MKKDEDKALSRLAMLAEQGGASPAEVAMLKERIAFRLRPEPPAVYCGACGEQARADFISKHGFEFCSPRCERRWRAEAETRIMLGPDMADGHHEVVCDSIVFAQAALGEWWDNGPAHGDHAPIRVLRMTDRQVEGLSSV